MNHCLANSLWLHFVLKYAMRTLYVTYMFDLDFIIIAGTCMNNLPELCENNVTLFLYAQSVLMMQNANCAVT